MSEFAAAFYNSKAWRDTRTAYRKKVGGLCERCLKEGRYVPGVIVHHKIHLTPATISDPSIALNFDNLELLCRDHHAAEHNKSEKRWKVDELGRVKTI